MRDIAVGRAHMYSAAISGENFSPMPDKAPPPLGDTIAAGDVSLAIFRLPASIPFTTDVGVSRVVHDELI
jgi:hypothetical protein